jgi:F-type H+-transporting ATPase subunit epsilon
VSEAREERREGRQLFCRIITPEEMVFDGQANLVVARIADGEIGVLVDHAPVVSAVEFGEVRTTEGDEKRIYATSDGFFKVSENLVQILVEEAVPAGEIDVNEAENRVEEAEKEISQLAGDEDAEDRRREADRRQRMGENLVHVARKYGEG